MATSSFRINEIIVLALGCSSTRFDKNGVKSGEVPLSKELLIFRVEAITDPWLCEDVARFGGIGFDLLAKLADEDAQVFGLFDVIAAPDGAQQCAVRERFIRVADEVDKQLVLL